MFDPTLDDLGLAREAAMHCAGAVASLVNAAYRGDDLTGAISHLDKALEFADNHLRPHVDLIGTARTSSDPVTWDIYSAASFHELAFTIATRLDCIGRNASRRLSEGATPGLAPETRNAIKSSFKKGGLDINWLYAGIKSEWRKAAALERRSPAAGAGQAESAVHNDDFTMVVWYGAEYHFALGVQSTAVRALWEEWKKSGLGLHQETIHKKVDPERNSFRMDTAFRGHAAFETMIQKCGDGRYKLAPPGSQPPRQPRKKAKRSAKGEKAK